jgi:ribosomal protein S18 acetylase RimI-like enzyme
VAPIVRLDEQGIGPASETLARSFFNDPLTVCMIPDGREGARLLSSHFTPFARYGYLFGEVHTTPTFDAVAVWLPSEAAEITADRAARCGLDKVEATGGSAAWRRFSRVMECLDQVHRSSVPGPHWYLPLIGVEPSRQGHGCGVAMLRAMLARIDDKGLSCYLETFQPTNVRFYQRSGFEIVAEGTESASGLLYWAFTRPPARANSGGAAARRDRRRHPRLRAHRRRHFRHGEEHHDQGLQDHRRT